MKSQSIQIILSFSFSFFLLFAGCKKDDASSGTQGSTNTPKGQLMFHLHTYLDNNEVDGPDINYTMDDGRKVSLSLAQFYVSNIQLVKLDGSIYDVAGVKILKRMDIDIYSIGDVPVGNYKSVRFKVGLDAATNQMDPFTSPDSVILSHHEMWFNNTAQPDGYVFLNVQGKIDVTKNATGTVAEMQPFVYKIGTNSHYIQINMPDENFTVIQGQAQYIHLLMDYYKLFNGIDLSNSAQLSSTTAAANNNPPATIVAGNIASAFRYEE